jgi:hypothetical protein
LEICNTSEFKKSLVFRGPSSMNQHARTHRKITNRNKNKYSEYLC